MDLIAATYVYDDGDFDGTSSVTANAPTDTTVFLAAYRNRKIASVTKSSSGCPAGDCNGATVNVADRDDIENICKGTSAARNDDKDLTDYVYDAADFDVVGGVLVVHGTTGNFDSDAGGADTDYLNREILKVTKPATGCDPAECDGGDVTVLGAITTVAGLRDAVCSRDSLTLAGDFAGRAYLAGDFADCPTNGLCISAAPATPDLKPFIGRQVYSVAFTNVASDITYSSIANIAALGGHCDTESGAGSGCTALGDDGAQHVIAGATLTFANGFESENVVIGDTVVLSDTHGWNVNDIVDNADGKLSIGATPVAYLDQFKNREILSIKFFNGADTVTVSNPANFAALTTLCDSQTGNGADCTVNGADNTNNVLAGAVITLQPCPEFRDATIHFAPCPELRRATFHYEACPELAAAVFDFEECPELAAANFEFETCPELRRATFDFEVCPELKTATFNMEVCPELQSATFAFADEEVVTSAAFTTPAPVTFDQNPTIAADGDFAAPPNGGHPRTTDGVRVTFEPSATAKVYLLVNQMPTETIAIIKGATGTCAIAGDTYSNGGLRLKKKLANTIFGHCEMRNFGKHDVYGLWTLKI